MWPAIVVLFIVCIRLALVGDRDIAAINSPHDEYWYIERALKGMFGGAYDQMAFMHLPVYSWWLTFLNVFGVPARLGIELAWTASGLYLAYALRNFTGRPWVSIALFGFLVLHPYTLVIFDRALSETLLTVTIASGIAAAIEIWSTRSVHRCRRRAFATMVFAASFALAYHLRKEGVVLFAPLAMLVVISYLRRDVWWAGDGLRRLVVPLIGGPLLATFAVGFAVASANAFKWGIFARYDLAATGYTRAVGALSSIDLGRTPRQITVTKAMLEAAYRESPTFSQLKPYMQGYPGLNWVAIAAPYTQAPGEIGNGWFYWALRDVAAAAGWHRSASDADRHYAAVADELELAFASGRLKRRSSAFSSFVDPDVGKWVGEVPGAVYRVGSLLVASPPGALAAPAETATPEQFDNYQRLASRHQPQSRITVGGWAIVPPGSLVGLKKDNVVVALVPVGATPRADVPGGYPFEIKASGLAPPYSIVLRDGTGNEGTATDDLLGVGKIVPFNGALKGPIGVDKLEAGTSSRRADLWIPAMLDLYEWIGYCALVLVAAGLGYAVLLEGLSSSLVAVSALLLVLIAARVVLFAILDASSWSGMQIRYVLPVVPALGVVAALGAAALLNLLPRKGSAT